MRCLSQVTLGCIKLIKANHVQCAGQYVKALVCFVYVGLEHYSAAFVEPAAPASHLSLWYQPLVEVSYRPIKQSIWSLHGVLSWAGAPRTREGQPGCRVSNTALSIASQVSFPPIGTQGIEVEQ